MSPRHAQLSADDSVFSAPVLAPARDHLALVPPPPAVPLTYADGVELRRVGPVWRRRLRRFPAGLVHAAEPGSRSSLCGVPLARLEAFGRSRHPFERFEESRRCVACDVAAGRPTA
jgi:hypothetical protein